MRITGTSGAGLREAEAVDTLGQLGETICGATGLGQRTLANGTRSLRRRPESRPTVLVGGCHQSVVDEWPIAVLNDHGFTLINITYTPG